MNKKAQESRNDLLVLYLVSFIMVVATVGGLYGLGVIGDQGYSLARTNMVTAAAVALPVDNNSNMTEEMLELLPQADE